MNEVIIIGGGGFLGKNLVRRMLSLGMPVAVADVLPPEQLAARFPSRTTGLRFMKIDNSNEGSISDSLAGKGPVVLLASTVTPAKSNTNIPFDIQSNLVFATRVLEQLRPTPERRMVFLSSGGTIYGVPQTLPIDEDHPTNPICSYGIVKLAIEKYMAMFNFLQGSRHISLRVSNPFGPGQNPHTGQGAIAAFVDRIMAGQTINIWGDGEIVRDYIHITDVADAIIAALHYDGDAQVFNIGSGEGTSLNHLIEKIGLTSGVKPVVTYVPGRAFDVPANVLDVTKARRELKWSPAIPLEAGLTALINDYRNVRK